MRINTNMPAMSAQRSLATNRQTLDKESEKLASGSRINRAADDASGLAIGETMKASIRSLRQANRNANDGISAFQVAEGGLNTIGNILVRFRELAIQASSDTIGDLERGFVNKEVGQLKQEIVRVAESTEFNGQKLLKGGHSINNNQVGINAGESFEYNTGELDARIETLKIEDLSLAKKSFAQNSISSIDSAINKVSEMRSVVGADQNRLFSISRNLENYHENLSAARSRIMDTDVAATASEHTKADILNQADIAVLSQANQSPQMALKLLS